MIMMILTTSAWVWLDRGIAILGGVCGPPIVAGDVVMGMVGVIEKGSGLQARGGADIWMLVQVISFVNLALV